MGDFSEVLERLERYKISEKTKGPEGPCVFLAEREGFEPSVMLPPRLISSQVHSTTLPPLRIVESAIVAGFLGPHEKFTLKYAEIYATKRSKPPM